MINHASLFSGIGGPEIAADMLGWTNLFHCEINSFCRQVLQYWWPNSKSYEDITQTNFEEWKGKVTVLTGGFPCQPFSTAGKRKGKQDDRFLWPHMYRAIREIQPTYVIAENVGGILSVAGNTKTTHMEEEATLFSQDRIQESILREESESIIEEIIQGLEDCLYNAIPLFIPACAVGAPHRRYRLFIVAYFSPFDHALRSRLESRHKKEPFQQTKQRNTCATNTLSFTNTDSWRSGEIPPLLQKRQSDGYVTKSNGHVRTSDTSYQIGSRWEQFPTVSPVHNGYDGFPFDAHRLTIPFTRWRKESLKALGNAIVPQVIYEIFRAIEQIENT